MFIFIMLCNVYSCRFIGVFFIVCGLWLCFKIWDVKVNFVVEDVSFIKCCLLYVLLLSFRFCLKCDDVGNIVYFLYCFYGVCVLLSN